MGRSRRHWIKGLDKSFLFCRVNVCPGPKVKFSTTIILSHSCQVVKSKFSKKIFHSPMYWLDEVKFWRVSRRDALSNFKLYSSCKWAANFHSSWQLSNFKQATNQLHCQILISYKFSLYLYFPFYYTITLKKLQILLSCKF